MKTDRRQLLTIIGGARAATASRGSGHAETTGQTAESSARETEAYRQAYGRMLDSSALDEIVRKLATMEVILVPGFLAQIYQKIGIVPCAVGPGRYFREQLAWLDRGKVKARYLDLNSQAPVEENGGKVADAIAAAGRVVLVTHSKGCLDSLAALVNHQELRGKVAAWVAMQGPFGGLPIADAIAGHGVHALPAAKALELLGGSGAALDDMRTDRRRAYHEDKAAPIEAVLRSVPTICYGSYMTGITCMTPLHEVSRRAGFPQSDGLVTPDSALLTGALGVVEAGVDHVMPVFGTKPQVLDSIRCVAALLAVRLTAS